MAFSPLSYTVGMQDHLLNDFTRIAQDHAELDGICSHRMNVPLLGVLRRLAIKGDVIRAVTWSGQHDRSYMPVSSDGCARVWLPG